MEGPGQGSPSVSGLRSQPVESGTRGGPTSSRTNPEGGIDSPQNQSRDCPGGCDQRGGLRIGARFHGRSKTRSRGKSNCTPLRQLPLAHYHHCGFLGGKVLKSHPQDPAHPAVLGDILSTQSGPFWGRCACCPHFAHAEGGRAERGQAF